MSNRFDRRSFLLGAGGAVLAIPMLETFAPRRAFAQAVAPPKRLIILSHEHGRCVGDGRPLDWWSPGATSRALPATGTAPSPQLAPLGAIRDEIVTIDGIDDIVRHASGNGDGHDTPTRSAFTCRLPMGFNNTPAGGPSVDFVAGTHLRSGPSMEPSLVFPASATPEGTFWVDQRFWNDSSSSPTVLSGNPRQTIAQLFAQTQPTMMPAQPTLHDRLVQRRGSILDGVTQALGSLRSRVSARDQMQLDHHANFIRTIELQQTSTGPGTVMAMGCRAPDPTTAPAVHPSTYAEFESMGEDPMWQRGRNDALTIPFQIENVVQALACDITRVAVLSLGGSDPTFESEFPSGSPFEQSGSWHATIHGIPRNTDSAEENTNANHVQSGYLYYSRVYTQLIQRLAQVQDADGSRLLDNTLVIWSSEMGHGATHSNFNLPVILAGLGSAFAKGRHIVENRRTTGDLYAHMLRLLGVSNDMTFGETGTLGQLAARNNVTDLLTDYGFAGYISASTPLHAGPLSL